MKSTGLINNVNRIINLLFRYRENKGDGKTIRHLQLFGKTIKIFFSIYQILHIKITNFQIIFTVIYFIYLLISDDGIISILLIISLSNHRTLNKHSLYLLSALLIFILTFLKYTLGISTIYLS